jgi:transcription termination/antitermination protein NusG
MMLSVTQTGEAMREMGHVEARLHGFHPNVATETGSWYAAQTRPRHEKKAAQELAAKNIHTFLPLVIEQRQWSDRRQVVHVPLFASYVFFRGGQTTSRAAVLSIAGVVQIVGSRGIGLPIPDEQIDAIRAIISDNVPFTRQPYTGLNVGQRVRIVGGSLDGIEGTLVKHNDNRSVVISFTSIQKSIAIQVAGYHLQAI